MAIKGRQNIGLNVQAVEVDHDPFVVGTDVPAGSWIFDSLGKPVRKKTSGDNTDVVRLFEQIEESFAATNARFFGELAVPSTQGWADSATGSVAIDLVDEAVFGTTKQVVRINDDFSDGIATSQFALTAQNWTDINAFGASFSGTSRLDTVNGDSGFFSGLQVNAAENPLVTGNRRYGINFENNGGNLRVTEADTGGTTVTFDGTGGNPLITFDEWMLWECVVLPGLGAAQFYINGILTTFSPTFLVNTGGLGTKIIVGSGSTSGVNRVTYHDNFGVTVYEESETKTLATTTMDSGLARVFIPEGKRDYAIVLPDGNPRPIGARLDIAANNLLGTVKLTNEVPAVPENLYNSLRTLTILITSKGVLIGTNTVNNANVYVGFDVKSEDSSAELELKSTTKGFLPPVHTTGSRDKIPNPAKGLMIYNKTIDQWEGNNGTPASPNWVILG